MNAREQSITQARKLVSDAQLIAFLTAVRHRHGVRDAEYVIKRLDAGQGLDDCFYTGDEFGYFLSAQRSSDTSLKITFGCQDDPLAEEGGEWLVSFAGNEIASLRHEVSWAC